MKWGIAWPRGYLTPILTRREHCMWKLWSATRPLRELTSREIYAGHCIPKGWGVAWTLWNRDAVVIAPVPLNIVIAALRWLWLKIKYPPWSYARANLEDAAYRRGREDARKFYYPSKPVSADDFAAYIRNYRRDLADLDRVPKIVVGRTDEKSPDD